MFDRLIITATTFIPKANQEKADIDSDAYMNLPNITPASALLITTIANDILFIFSPHRL